MVSYRLHFGFCPHHSSRGPSTCELWPGHSNRVGDRWRESPALLGAAELAVWGQALLGVWLPEVTFVFAPTVEHQAECGAWEDCGAQQRSPPLPIVLTLPVTSAWPLTPRALWFWVERAIYSFPNTACRFRLSCCLLFSLLRVPFTQPSWVRIPLSFPEASQDSPVLLFFSEPSRASASLSPGQVLPLCRLLLYITGLRVRGSFVG